MPLLPEITLRAAGKIPPTVLLLAPDISLTPAVAFGSAIVPVGSVPIELPSMKLLLLAFRMMGMLNRFITRPRTILPLVLLPKTRPLFWLPGGCGDRISINSTALVPIVIGFVLGLVPGCV